MLIHRKNMTQNQVETVRIWFTRINHLVHDLCDYSICNRKHNQFLLTITGHYGLTRLEIESNGVFSHFIDVTCITNRLKSRFKRA